MGAKPLWELDYLVALEGQELSDFLFISLHNRGARLLFGMLLGVYFLVL